MSSITSKVQNFLDQLPSFTPKKVFPENWNVELHTPKKVYTKKKKESAPTPEKKISPFKQAKTDAQKWFGSFGGNKNKKEPDPLGNIYETPLNKKLVARELFPTCDEASESQSLEIEKPALSKESPERSQKNKAFLNAIKAEDVLDTPFFWDRGTGRWVMDPALKAEGEKAD